MTKNMRAPKPTSPEMIDAANAAATQLIDDVAATQKKAHDDTLAALQVDYDAAMAKIDGWKGLLASSFEKALTDAEHIDYARSFINHVSLISDESTAWIKRHV